MHQRVSPFGGVPDQEHNGHPTETPFIFLLEDSAELYKVSTSAQNNGIGGGSSNVTISGGRITASTTVATTSTAIGGTSSKVAIGLEVALAAGQNVAQASDAIRAAVSEQMDNVLGLADYSIDISIAEFAGMDAAKKSRVS